MLTVKHSVTEIAFYLCFFTPLIPKIYKIYLSGMVRWRLNGDIAFAICGEDFIGLIKAIHFFKILFGF